MTVPVYINEIKSFQVHTSVVDGEPVHTTANYTLLLPHLSPDFRNKSDNNVAVSCFPPFPFNQIVEEMICDYIINNVQNSDTNIFFDNVYEGHVLSCLAGIHKIIDRLGLPENKCHFISGAMQAQDFYDSYCSKNNISNKINIIVLNSWERHISLSTKTNNIPEPEFQIKNKDKLFLCFNRIYRQHRVALLGLLYSKNLVNDSYYSFFPELTYGGNINPDFNGLKPLLSLKTYETIINELNNNYYRFPLILNNLDGSNTNSILADDAQYYQNSYFSIVTETFFFKNSDTQLRWDEESVFFSEKIFKPIMGKHPFMLLSRPRSLEYLKKIGYKTFHPFIDETYDTIENDELRLIIFVNEVERLSKFTPDQWLKFLAEVQDVVEFNYNLLSNKSADDYQYYN